jgi:hypothetical protein
MMMVVTVIENISFFNDCPAMRNFQSLKNGQNIQFFGVNFAVKCDETHLDSFDDEISWNIYGFSAIFWSFPCEYFYCSAFSRKWTYYAAILRVIFDRKKYVREVYPFISPIPSNHHSK